MRRIADRMTLVLAVPFLALAATLSAKLSLAASPSGDRRPPEIRLLPSPTASDNISTDGNTPEVRPIDLPTALQLAEARSPLVAFTREQVKQSYARLERANTLWLPSLRGGVGYNRHEGAIQDVAGSQFDASRGAFYSGLGAAPMATVRRSFPAFGRIFSLPTLSFSRWPPSKPSGPAVQPSVPCSTTRCSESRSPTSNCSGARRAGHRPRDSRSRTETHGRHGNLCQRRAGPPIRRRPRDHRAVAAEEQCGAGPGIGCCGVREARRTLGPQADAAV